MIIHRLLRDFAKYLPSRVLPALTAFITMPIITRVFSPTEYGQYIVALLVADLFYALFVSGLGSAGLRFYPEYARSGRVPVFFGSFFLSVGSAVSVATVIALGSLAVLRPLIGWEISRLVQVSILLFGVRSVSNVLLDIARSQERGGAFSIFSLSARYLGLTISLTMVFAFAYGVEALLWGPSIAYLALLPGIFLTTLRGTRLGAIKFSLSATALLVRWAIPIGLGSLAIWALNASDRYVVAIFRGEEETGLYSIGYQIAEKTIAIFVSLFILSMEALVVNTWEKEGRQATESALSSITRTYLALCLPAVTGLTILAQPVLQVLTTDAYLPGARVVGLVAFSMLFWGLCMIAIMALVIEKKTWRIARAQFGAAAVNLGMNLILVPQFGFVAAGATTLVCFAGLCLVLTVDARRFVQWGMPIRTIANITIASALMGIVLYGSSKGLMRIVLLPDILSILIASLWSGFLYFLFLRLLGEPPVLRGAAVTESGPPSRQA